MNERSARLWDLLELAATWLVMRERQPAAPPFRTAMTWHLWRYTLDVSKRLERAYWRQVSQ